MNRHGIISIVLILIIIGVISLGAGIWRYYAKQASHAAFIKIDKTSLTGVDSDNNGVRDDIDQYIATTYPNSAKTRAALTQMAVAVQTTLTDFAQSKPSSTLAADLDHEIYGVRCVAYIVGADKAKIAIALENMITNTHDRLLAHLRAGEATHELPAPAPLESELKKFCTFNPSALPN